MENKSTILVTGNKGYIGSVLTDILLEKGYDIVGFDTNYYSGLEKRTSNNFKQLIGDIRKISHKDLAGIDSIIHLAALSNDPLGEFNKNLTYEINYKATIRLAKMAKSLGIGRFVYSSSQSMYGISDQEEELDEDNSEKNPLTEYARTKWEAEVSLKKLCTGNFVVTCFRPSTVFGWSPSLRCDIVYNNLVASAYTSGEIVIKSDGSPWRPVVHVRDVCNAFIAGLEAPKSLVLNESFNVGIENGNFTVKELALAAQKVVPKSGLKFTGEHGSDSRTYKVSFKKILNILSDYYKPEWDLIKGGEELVDNFARVHFHEEDFVGSKCTRLNELKENIESKKLDKNLFWN